MQSDFKPLDRLVYIIDKLLAPDGCPWDREQTVDSVSRMLHEEVCEMLDEVQSGVHEKLADEIGDIFVGVVFLAKIAEKEKRFLWSDPLSMACEKLVRRHPHIFENYQELSSEQVEKRWAEVKAKEKTHVARKTYFDSIASSLPALAMMQKLVAVEPERVHIPVESEQERVGQRLTEVILEAQKAGIDAEFALRSFFNKCRTLAD